MRIDMSVCDRVLAKAPGIHTVDCTGRSFFVIQETG